MSDALAVIAQLQGIPLWVLWAVLVVTTLFLVLYLPRSIYLGLQIGLLARRIRALRQSGVEVAPDSVGRVLSREPYRRLWAEYADSLHLVVAVEGKSAGASGLRATTSASHLFTRDALVDARLFDEFVRHLPGILTGLGIIGTFAGLLTGLQGFNPSEDPSAARLGLKTLLGGVEHAFYASAVAIACAMLITLLEKFAIARCYQAADTLAHTIDTLYSGGAGEDYLARLVRSADANAQATAALKDALAAELRTTLAALGERQLAQQRQQGEALGAQLAKAVGEGLAQPIRELVAVVGAGAAQPRNGAQAPLEDVVAALATRLADTVENALAKTAAQQDALNAQTRAIVVDIGQQAREQREQGEQALRTTVRSVMAEFGDALSGLAEDRQVAARAQQRRQEQFDADVGRAYGGLSVEIGRLVEKVGDSVERSDRHIAAIERVSLQAVDGIGEGIDALNAAAQRFASAGQAVSTTIEQVAQTGEAMSVTALSLQQVGATVERALSQYELARAGIDAQLGSLGALIENAKTEAGLNKELLADMQSSVESLRGVQQASNHHLDLVNEKLVAAFEAFGDSMKVQVAGVMRQTDQHTSTAMQHLLGVVQELGGALARVKRA